MPRYASVSLLKTTHLSQLHGTTEQDGALGHYLDTASTIVDGELGYSFTTTATPASKIVYGEGTPFLEPPTFTAGSVTLVAAPVGYSVPSYVEYGAFLATVDAAGLIYTPPAASLAYGARYSSVWLARVPYTVTATYAVVPTDIIEATMEIATQMWKFRDSGGVGVIGIEGAGLTTVQNGYSARTKATLDRYRRRSLGVW